MSISRREFLSRSAATATMASLACVSGTALAQEAGEKKIRFAQIGCGGRGGAHHGVWRSNEFVAACDANGKTLNMFSSQALPNLRRYTNYQEMYEKEMDNIDAVIVATPDHNHYAASMPALMAGKAVFCEKPLAWSVQECLDLARVVAAKKVPSQMGNQGNAGMGWRTIYSIVHSDIIGKVSSVHTWTNRPIWPQGNPRPEGEDPVPEGFDWNAWIGVAPMRPYKGNRIYEPFVWRGFYDFGCGALGDMACHTMNAMFQVMKPDYDVTVEPLVVDGTSDDQFPSSQVIKWLFAKSGNCPGFEAYWYDGGKRPDKPEAVGENNLPNTGSMFVGSKGVLISASDYNDQPTVYVDGQVIQPQFEQLVKPSDGGMHGEFVKAVRGEAPWDAPMSNFAYAGKMTAIINMGTVAQRVGKKIAFNPKTMKFDDPKANEFMGRKPREGWEKAYKV